MAVIGSPGSGGLEKLGTRFSFDAAAVYAILPTALCGTGDNAAPKALEEVICSSQVLVGNCGLAIGTYVTMSNWGIRFV